MRDYINPDLYRSTRESSFSLSLSLPQIEGLIRVLDNVRRFNRDVDVRLERQPDPSKHDPLWLWTKVPEWVEKGNSDTRLVGIAYVNSATSRVLRDKGLVTVHNGHVVLTEAGWLAYRLLTISGHIQEALGQVPVSAEAQA